MCAKNCKNTLKIVKVIPGKLEVLFPDTMYIVLYKHTHLL